MQVFRFRVYRAYKVQGLGPQTDSFSEASTSVHVFSGLSLESQPHIKAHEPNPNLGLGYAGLKNLSNLSRAS